MPVTVGGAVAVTVSVPLPPSVSLVDPLHALVLWNRVAVTVNVSDPVGVDPVVARFTV
jgi:hypothetical protein